MDPETDQDMKHSQEKTAHTYDEIEDLTLFADESFDTDDIDLFEFSGEDDSPLTRLKSIILSLDWEISDDILQELEDEVYELQQLWPEDKIALLYLQGLEKLGRYLRSEGAYAHPNSIKLLLTFYYDFEKIISSPDLEKEEINTLLAVDVRKFKILQYQISQTTRRPGQDSENENESLGGIESGVGDDPRKLLKATILGLEWEVTEAGLKEFAVHLNAVREHIAKNKYTDILINGLQVLGKYISHEKVNAHPESFTLLHSFYEGLEILLEDDKISEADCRAVLVDRVNRINNLKAIIAGVAVYDDSNKITEEELDAILEPHGTETSEDEPGSEVEEKLQPLKAETFSPDLDTVKPAMETADTQYPDDVLDPDAIQPVTDAIADDFIAEELKGGGKLAPALSALEEDHGLHAEEEDHLAATPSESIDEELDILFEQPDEAPHPPEQEPEDVVAFSLTEDDERASDQADEDIETELDALFGSDDEADEGPAPALADFVEEGGFIEEAVAGTLDETKNTALDEKLDFFFGDEETSEEPATEVQETPSAALEETPDIMPALADADEESGFNEESTVEGLTDKPNADLEDKLDFFFSDEDKSAAITPDDSPLNDDEFIAALSADIETKRFGEEAAGTAHLQDAIADDLDAFFDLSDEEKQAEQTVEEAESFDDISAALSETSGEGLEEKLDEFFNAEEEEAADISTLGNKLALLSTSPDPQGISESLSMVEELKLQYKGTQKVVILELLHSVLTLMPQDDSMIPGASKALINFLYENLTKKKGDDPELLVTAIRRCTAWQKEMYSTLRGA